MWRLGPSVSSYVTEPLLQELFTISFWFYEFRLNAHVTVMLYLQARMNFYLCFLHYCPICVNVGKRHFHTLPLSTCDFLKN
jgi:hypothetical protein